MHGLIIGLGVLSVFLVLILLEVWLRMATYKRMLIAEKLEREGKLRTGLDKKSFVLLDSPALLSEELMQTWYDEMKEALERHCARMSFEREYQPEDRGML